MCRQVAAIHATGGMLSTGMVLRTHRKGWCQHAPHGYPNNRRDCNNLDLSVASTVASASTERARSGARRRVRVSKWALRDERGCVLSHGANVGSFSERYAATVMLHGATRHISFGLYVVYWSGGVQGSVLFGVLWLRSALCWQFPEPARTANWPARSASVKAQADGAG